MMLVLTLVSATAVRKFPFLLVGWLWFLGTLMPVIGLVHVGDQAMADHHTYLPGIGLFIMLMWGAATFLAGNRRRYLPAAWIAGALLLVLGGLSFRQAGYWHDSVTLFNHALAVTENNHLAHYNLGEALLEKGELAEAARHFRAAVSIRPTFDEAWTNLGVVLGMSGRHGEAIGAFRRALALNPQDADAHLNLGLASVMTGDMGQARLECRILEGLNPAYDQRLCGLVK